MGGSGNDRLHGVDVLWGENRFDRGASDRFADELLGGPGRDDLLGIELLTSSMPWTPEVLYSSAPNRFIASASDTRANYGPVLRQLGEYPMILFVSHASISCVVAMVSRMFA